MQPMPHGKDRTEHPEGPIVPNRPPSELRAEPYSMPAGFEWSNVDIQDDAQRLELYHLLANNYVEDDDALFRFDYSQEFLLWAVTPPHYNTDFIFGVRSSKTKKLVAFISGIPTRIKVHEKEVDIVEINFLCVHKKLRAKRLAPVLIKEVTRRVNWTGVFQAVYTAGTVLPVPVASARYYHRSLNPKKLVAVGFSRPTNARMTTARMVKIYKLPEVPVTPGLRPMEERDVDAVHTLLNNYLSKFKLKILFTHDEIRHWLLPRDKVINSYVVETTSATSNKTNKNMNQEQTTTTTTTTTTTITDFISFYHLPSSILHHNDTLYAAYSFYNVATSVSLQALIKDALILAKQAGADVYNALDLMDNQPETVLQPLKFGMGDGTLQYYIYNWACPDLQPSQVGIVLL
jgi:glycylpeptide N-tetradecanoyltransferase